MVAKTCTECMDDPRNPAPTVELGVGTERQKLPNSRCDKLSI